MRPTRKEKARNEGYILGYRQGVKYSQARTREIIDVETVRVTMNKLENYDIRDVLNVLEGVRGKIK